MCLYARESLKKLFPEKRLKSQASSDPFAPSHMSPKLLKSELGIKCGFHFSSHLLFGKVFVPISTLGFEL
jgi:hypothetical protein